MDEARNLEEIRARLEDEEGLVDAEPYMRGVIAGDLRAARTEATLSQDELAPKLKVPLLPLTLPPHAAPGEWAA